MFTDPSGHSWFSKFWKNHGRTITSIFVAVIIAFVAPALIPALAGGGFWAAVGIGALAGAGAGAVATGTLKGTMQGAVFGAISAGVAFGVAEVSGQLAGVGSLEAHVASILKTGLNKVSAIKTMLHGLSRGIISKLQGGTFKAGFVSGLSSGLDIGTKGYGGFVGRTTIMGIIGGTASALGGGKFSNGAMSGAFMHMFNAESGLLTKSFESLAKGLYRFGDYVGRISGFRDWQVGSVALENYQQELAITETKAVGTLVGHAVSNPSLTTKAVSVYYNYNESQMDANTLVNFYIGLAVPAIGVVSLAGNTMHEAHNINQIYKELGGK